MLSGLRKSYYNLRIPNLSQRAEKYRHTEPDEVAVRQLVALNSVWAQAQKDIPFYSDLAHEIKALNGFSSLSHYAEVMPILKKSDLSGQSARSTENYDFMRMTGGSSGTPTHLPAWISENAFAREALLIGRLWNGIEPGDSLCLIWGHSHLLGRGLQGWLNGNKRRLKDRLLGYTRISSYDLSSQAMDRMAAYLRPLSFDCVLGYARALDAIARHIEARRSAPPQINKAIVATAEALPFNDSRAVIERVFGAPLVLEYGAVETGPIAYTLPGAGYNVCWWTYLVEAQGEELLVTALYPRATPLFRYAIGDLIGGVTVCAQNTSVINFGNIIGRSNTPVILPSGRRLHSEVASHVFRSIGSVQHYQLECHEDHILGRYVAERELSDLEKQTLRRISYSIDPEYGELLRFQRCQFGGLTQSVAGKIPFVTYKHGSKL